MEATVATHHAAMVKSTDQQELCLNWNSNKGLAGGIASSKPHRKIPGECLQRSPLLITSCNSRRSIHSTSATDLLFGHHIHSHVVVAIVDGIDYRYAMHCDTPIRVALATATSSISLSIPHRPLYSTATRSAITVVSRIAGPMVSRSFDFALRHLRRRSVEFWARHAQRENPKVTEKEGIYLY